MLIRFFLVAIISLPSSLFAMEVAVNESVNFCSDTQASINNDVLAAKYPEDERIVTLVALRTGLCDLLDKEIIDLDYAIGLFNEMKEFNIRERLQETESIKKMKTD